MLHSRQAEAEAEAQHWGGGGGAGADERAGKGRGLVDVSAEIGKGHPSPRHAAVACVIKLSQSNLNAHRVDGSASATVPSCCA